MSKYWFRKKRLGIGSTPSSWEGWLAVTVYLALIILAAFWLKSEPVSQSRVIVFAGIVIALTIVIAALGAAKTEGGFGLGGRPDDKK